MNLRFDGVSFTYPSGVEALRSVDLVVDSGQALGVLGENGAGKTTLARHINGLLKPARGRVLVEDWDTSQHTVAQLARRVAYVFQNPGDQLFERTVGREIAFGPRNLGCSEGEVKERVAHAAALTGLEEDLDRHPYDLHAVRRKWIGLASAFAMQTPILVLDEPTSGLDERGKGRLAGIVERLKVAGCTLIVISHDVDFCAENFERLVLMSGGRIFLDGDAANVLTQTERLALAGVDPPQLLRLARGLGLAGQPLTADEFLETYAGRLW